MVPYQVLRHGIDCDSDFRNLVLLTHPKHDIDEDLVPFLVLLVIPKHGNDYVVLNYALLAVPRPDNNLGFDLEHFVPVYGSDLVLDQMVVVLVVPECYNSDLDQLVSLVDPRCDGSYGSDLEQWIPVQNN